MRGRNTGCLTWPDVTPPLFSTPARPGRWYPWKVLTVTALGNLLVFLNSTSVNVALPAISADFGSDAATADWYLLSYALALTGFILVLARISDLLGRRSFYLGGLALFTLASLAGAIAGGPEALILARVLQGVAAAAILVNANAQIADAFPPRLLATGLSVNIMMASVSSMIGPIVGGALLDAFGWRALFLVNVPFGVVGVVLGLLVLRRDGHRPPAGSRFDVAGALLSVLALGALLFGVNRLSAWGFADARPYLALGLSAAAFVAFVLVERRVRSPLVDLGLVTEKARGLAYATAFLMAFAQAAVLVVVVLYLQLVRGASAAETGIYAAITAASIMLASPVSGWLTRWFSSRTVSTAGATITALGYALLAGAFAGGGAGALLIVGLVLIGAGIGVFTAPNTAAIMGGLPPEKRAISNGIRSVLFNGAQAFGTAVVLLLIGTWLADAGADGYAESLAPGAGASAVAAGFAAIAGLLGLLSAAAAGCSAARGGPWRAPSKAA